MQEDAESCIEEGETEDDEQANCAASTLLCRRLFNEKGVQEREERESSLSAVSLVLSSALCAAALLLLLLCCVCQRCTLSVLLLCCSAASLPALLNLPILNQFVKYFENFIIQEMKIRHRRIDCDAFSDSFHNKFTKSSRRRSSIVSFIFTCSFKYVE